MRPLKLIMSAFGPYSEVEVIDFNMLNNKNIFLITGPTGAGKTTIFDAISYALFGEASGTSRDNDSLRSDFSSSEISTYVELTFELRGKVYSITRFPQQQKKKARGEGFVLKNAEASLIPPVGVPITGVNAVNESIDRILGINKNQFRQIVMLPQGEFRKLLEADSLEREIIFRKIFGTEAFEAVQRKLEEQRKALYGIIRDNKTKRDENVKHIEAGSDDLLLSHINAENLNIVEIVNKTLELVDKDLQESQKIKLEYDGFKIEQIRFQKSIAEGKEINKKFIEKHEIQELYNFELAKVMDYEEKQIKLNKSRKALEVKVIEDSFKERQNNLIIKEEEYRLAGIRLNECEKNLAYCKLELDKEEEKVAYRKEISDNIVTLKNCEKKVREYEEKNIKILKLREDAETKEKALDKLKQFVKLCNQNLEKANKDLNEAHNAEIQSEQLNKSKLEKEIVIEDLRNYYKNTKAYISEYNEYANVSRSYEEFENAYKELKDKYEVMDDSFRRGQAGLLARNLKAGTECPVCGSCNHPKLAQMINGVPSEDELKVFKIELDKKTKDRDEKLTKLTNLNGSINKGKITLLEQKEKLAIMLGEEINKIKQEDMIEFLTLKGKKLANEYETLKKEYDLLLNSLENKPKLEELIIKLGTEIRDKEVLKENSEEEYRSFYKVVAGEEESLKNLELEIPQEIRSTVKLSAKIKSLEEELEIHVKAYKSVQENFGVANTSIASAATDKELKGENVAQATREAKASRELLYSRLRLAGFEDLEQYTSLRMPEEKIKQLELDIIEYNKGLQSLKDRACKAVKDTDGLNEIDIDKLLEALTGLDIEEQNLKARELEVTSRIKNNKSTLQKIENFNKIMAEDEGKYTIIGELAKIAGGDNSERITFERYVLAAYFDEIINAANLRLNKMTGGRFILGRKEEKGKGLKQQGLELEVFDNYTGKARHVRTLSGGESFKVSLALALGLADVVQSHAGGISLDTMFVDEGFGTLDPESLDNAIQCLIDLQKSGRLVAIISHVPELKERIDVRLEITPAKEGSRARFVM